MIIGYFRWQYITEIMVKNMTSQRIAFLHNTPYWYKSLPRHVLYPQVSKCEEGSQLIPFLQVPNLCKTLLLVLFSLSSATAYFTTVPSNRTQWACYDSCTTSAVPHNNSAPSQNSGNSNKFLDAEEPDFNMAHLKGEKGNRRWWQMKIV